jgi:PBP1b-binding outer membrane lipoprotein LpoB
MKKNIIILIISILFLTGCTSEYTLEFSNKKIKENITVDILDSDIPNQNTQQVAEVDDSITPFIENDQYPFMDNTEKKYIKKVTSIDGGKRVNLKYTYSHNDFKNSKTYNMCFEKKSFNELRKGYSLNFSGKFYCRYTDEVAIKIKTNNVVINHNADKVEGNTYIWYINSKNVDDVNISMELSNKVTYSKYIIYGILGIVAVVLLFAGLKIYEIIKTRDNVNDL